LGEHLKDAVEMRHPRAEPIDKFGKHELAVKKGVKVLVNFFSELVKKFRLDTGEGFGGLAAFSGKMRIGLAPLPEFNRSLSLCILHVVDEVFEQLGLPLLDGQQLTQEHGHFGKAPRGRRCRWGSRLGDIDLGKKWRPHGSVLAHGRYTSFI
jgi:hypothetical protein